MEAMTLVLDVSYQPLRLCTWQEAIVWVLERIVETIDAYPDRQIRTVNWSVPMPSIVRFVRPISRKRAVKFSRHGIYARDGARCQYCGARVARDAFTYDHVVPRALGGRTCWENVVVACVSCNQRKGGRTPAQAGMHLLLAPVKPKRLPKFGPLLLQWRQGMPVVWKDWLRDAAYWGGDLESDEK